jgi:5-methylcytosine-specific restriction endonuclease McrA
VARDPNRRHIRASTKAAVLRRHDCQPNRELMTVYCWYCMAEGLLFWTIAPGETYGFIRLEDGFEWDHIIPVSRGGTNEPENIEIACHPCNASKFNHVDWESPLERDMKEMGLDWREPVA